jgi:hypothetical protein
VVAAVAVVPELVQLLRYKSTVEWVGGRGDSCSYRINRLSRGATGVSVYGIERWCSCWGCSQRGMQLSRWCEVRDAAVDGWWFGGLAVWCPGGGRGALHMQRAGNEASVGECLRQSATSESVAAGGRAQRCSGKRARVMGSNYGRRRRCSGRGWRCEVSWRSAADEIGPHFWWLAKGTERGIGIVFGCCFARQRIIRTSTRCPSTIRRDALPCGRSCTHSSQHAHSTLTANSRAGCVGERLCLVLRLFCLLAAAMLAPTPRPLHARRRPKGEDRQRGPGGVAVSKLGRPGTRANCPLCVAAHMSSHASTWSISPTASFCSREGRGEDRTQCTHARNTHTQHVLSAGLSPTCPHLRAARPLRAHCSSPLSSPPQQHVVHHASRS